METEIKLLIQPVDVERLKGHPLLDTYASEKPREQQQSAVYFDTPDLRIRHAHAHLRVRQANGEWMQTFKADVAALAGLHQRQEWESPVDGPQPDLERLREQLEEQPWQDLLHAFDPKELRPVFTTDITRTLWTLRLPKNDEVLVTLDQGTLERGEQSVPISELELELRSGRAECLFDLALTLLEHLPLQLDSRSKPDLGYALLSPLSPEAVHATPVDLTPAMSTEQAFQAIVRNCLSQIQANETGVAHGQTPNSLHQMRVGLRRLRSALRLHEKVIACPTELQEELEELTTQLGKTRDWDVLVDSTLPWVAQASKHAASASAIRIVARDKARACHEAASALLQSPRYSQLMLRLGGWLEGAGWRQSPQTQMQRLDKPVAKFAEQTLLPTQKRLRKRGKGLAKADPRARHRVRIAAKRLRYASEFFQALYPKKAMQAYIQALSKLQDTLGRLNDAATARELLHELRDAHSQFTEAFVHVETDLDNLQRDELARLRQRWQRFLKRDLPRRKAS